MLREESGRQSQLREKFGDELRSLLVNVKVPEELTNGEFTPFSEPQKLLSRSKMPKLWHQPIRKATMNDGGNLFISLVKYLGENSG